MGKRIVIAGAGGFGRGVYSWLHQSPNHRRINNISEIVFIDDESENSLAQTSIVSTIRDYFPLELDEVVVAVGVPGIRRRVVRSLEQRSVVFHTFIDDRAVIGDRVDIDSGAIICPGTVISAHAQIGKHVHVNFNCSIGHDTFIDEFTTLSPMVNVMGQTLVGRDVFIGGSATILPRITISSRTTIGAGAVVVKSIQHESTFVGNPARPVSLKKTSGELGEL